MKCSPTRSSGATGQASLDKNSHRFAKKNQCCFVRVFLCGSVAERGLLMKSVLIFGGARGIGKAVARAFVSKGFCVTVAARTWEQVEETVRELFVKGEALGCWADVSVYREVEGAVESHLSRFEGLDVVVNAAAIQGPIGPLWENDPEDWARNISINLIGSFNICHAVIPAMKKARDGVIILFSGGGAAYARPSFSAYGCSKTGVLRLVETIHKELQEISQDRKIGVRIYAVAPGAVRTSMTKEVLSCATKAGEKAYQEAMQTTQGGGTPPEKAAELCLYLATEQPSCLSGRLVHVNEPYCEYVKRYEGKENGDFGLLRRKNYE